MSDWLVGLSGIVGGLLVAAVIAWAAGGHSVLFADVPVFLLCAVFAYAVQWLVFDGSAPLWIVILAAAAAGVVLSELGGWLLRRRKRRR